MVINGQVLFAHGVSKIFDIRRGSHVIFSPMVFDIRSIGRGVKQARLLGGVSQAGLAARAGVSRATINALENGSIKEIGVNRLSRIVSVAESLPPATPEAGAVACSGGKPDVLNLSFPYDWSNPNIADDVLIAKVIERGLFEDIVRVAAWYGMKKVRAAADSFAADNPLAASGLHRMLGNISKVAGIA